MDLITADIWILLGLAAFLAGFIDAIAGGGGLLTIPALLTVGMPPHLTLGTNKLAATFGSFTASMTFYRQKLFQPQYWLTSICCTAIGAMIGTFAVSIVNADVLEKTLPAIVLATAIYSYLAPMDTTHDNTSGRSSRNRWIKATQGITLGFYDGLAGPGTGAFWTLSTLKLHRLNLLFASGVARSMNFISNGVSLVVFIYLGYVNWLIGLTMGVCIMAGAFIGARSAIKFGSRFIRPVFIFMVSAMAAKLCWEAWL
ncbi:TSUP family transporter [Echinimonas agarilytica]|uniref:Probable membrane transporter protein n=1 Tax=Echinimonas agarilytica TaxID=1215918 RepID=A0AA41W6K9_9GAMM|nr:TSUP family transporter [Echinimonas agarilytica]MCM2679820.1 TSUP family transporter [Echinimonas agarilytica]